MLLKHEAALTLHYSEKKKNEQGFGEICILVMQYLNGEEMCIERQVDEAVAHGCGSEQGGR